MNLRFVEAFHWAVSLKSVTRAAQKLHITQSALSARIAALEEELGTVLVDRRDKQFRLTVAGQRFHVLALRLLEVQRQVRAEMSSHAGRAMVLRLGAIESVVHSWLTGWLQQMRSSHPDFELELTVETSPVLVDQMRRGALDLVFAALPASDSAVRTLPLPPMPMVFVGHAAQHTQPRYSLLDLSCMELLTFQRGSQPHQALLALFEQHRAPVPRVHTISSISAMVQLVEGGFGVATLPRATVPALARGAPLHELVAERALQPLPIHASFREDPTSTLTRSVLESAQAYLGQSPG
ncbi:MAG TPA: LysR family transcriptional regulator [Burkholderiaceae bacterium]|nr:LysR family transcriptional regulator [Burkholderiaceae bacterium]HMY98591.1 LysR family transcriptional regulator [Burkholderiaceae bacterium]HNB44310.1 LysR family transcriptional regulator [Burkholderiaceae bacterium]HNG79710.1 LysR family transcriptional regulator [Burkholderiaceae bacterium]